MRENDQIRCRRVSYQHDNDLPHQALRPWRKLLQLVGNGCHMLATVKTLCQANSTPLDSENLWKDLNLMTIKTFSSMRSCIIDREFCATGVMTTRETLGTCSIFVRIYNKYIEKVIKTFLADRNNGRAYVTVLRLSSSSVCRLYGMYCG